MRKSTPILLSVTVLLIVSLACAVPAAPTQDINSLGTAIMQTMVFALTQTAGAAVPIDLLESPIATFTPEPPTMSPTATLSPTPLFTVTPLVPQISVSTPTNCRVGPGKVYDRVGALLVGEVAEVVGRDATGAYWFIRNPDQINGYCWLWGQYATLSGNIAVLPVFTPPPTPTPVPAFEAEYEGQDTCVGWWIELKLSNTGGLAFRSLSLTVRDTTTDTVLSMYSDNFTNLDGCLDSSTKETLAPGASRVISSPPFAYDPTGHKLRATITLCSEDGQSGTCETHAVKFTP
ncbi:MAG TPA: SH3 domain-containing protein [Anaerolineales bacterium]|nr:SH3 domain-containing protein [Anaerolineales bacterium]